MKKLKFFSVDNFFMRSTVSEIKMIQFVPKLSIVKNAVDTK